MRKFVILSCLILLTTITCFSQNILVDESNDTVVLITPQQLKETNLIFAEHQKLLVEKKLLLNQLNNYKLDNDLLSYSDSIKSLQVDNYKNLANSYSIQIEELNQEIQKKNKSLLTWKISSITISVGLLVWLLLK